jgi:hypothetical protein
MTKNKPESTSRSRDNKGQWKRGASGNPTGRPVSNPARRLLMEKSEELVNKAIERALAGDVAALNVCLSRIIPQYRPQQAPVKLDVPAGGDLVEIGRRIISAAAAGDCPPDVAAQLLQGLGTLARVEEVGALKERLAALEMALGHK